MSSDATWWGRRECGEEAANERIGPLAIELTRPDGEWRLRWQQVGEPLDATVGRTDAPRWGDFAVARLATEADGIDVAVASADRALVTRPHEPFLLPAGSSETIFVGAPLWFQIRVEGAALIDEPIVRPSDTWFGPPTNDGELCYASRTRCAREATQLPWRPHRSLTRVRIVNRSGRPLTIDRLKLPVRHLSLFVDDGGRLWTEDVELAAVRDDQFAEVAIGESSGATDSMRVTEPRLETPKGFAVRAFGGLLESWGLAG